MPCRPQDGDGPGEATQRGGNDSPSAPLPRVPASALYAVKLLPHPQPPVAFGFVKVNPLPCMEET